MLYLKLFILYSIIGFTFESDVFKISKTNKHSSILYGPYTIIYGLGGLLSFLVNNLLENINNIYLNYFLSFLIFIIICTLIEFIGGNLIKLIFNIDQWDYSNHKYHFGKYICLDYALIWGILAFIFIKLANNLLINLLEIIPNYLALIIILIMFIDFILIIHKKNKE